MAWYAYVAKQAQPQRVAATNTPALSPTPIATASAAPVASPPPNASASPSPSVAPFPEVTETLRNSDVELQITNRGGGIAQAVLLNHIAEDHKRVTLNSSDHIPIGAMIEDPAAPVLPEYKIIRQGDVVQVEHVAANQITIRKKFFFAAAEKKDNFVAELDVDLTNAGAQSYTNPGYFVAVGAAAPIHQNDYSTYTRLVWCVNGSAKGVDVGWFTGGSGFLGVGQRAPQQFYNESIKGAEWVAATDQFFTTLIAPLTDKADAVWGRRFDVDPTQKIYGIEGAMHMPGFQLQSGQTYSVRFEIYTGPKLYHKLATLPHNEAEVMELGFFKIISQALLNALNTLHSILWNSYAAAILALTTIVKLVLWPLQNKANRSARQMAALSPKMQELREKYKDDPTKMNQELMKLYKEYGINPVGGCLPMVIQIPIFFGLFTMLRQAVELRNATFFWIHDLSQPDTVARIDILGWSIPINILPLIMAATSFWMMHLTPKSGDPTQQRMMMFTPLIFIVFCYNFAAALALYYTTQNLLTILQLYHNRRQPMPKLEKVAPKGKGK
jgi:YidC/Oxa1 family membrane protein insertase